MFEYEGVHLHDPEKTACKDNTLCGKRKHDPDQKQHLLKEQVFLPVRGYQQGCYKMVPNSKWELMDSWLWTR